MGSKPNISSFTIIVTFLCIALAGIAFVPLLPIKLSPSRTLPKLSISYHMPSNSARVIEMEVTSRLEAMLARIKGIKEISSTSGNGWGRITLELDKHTNIDGYKIELYINKEHTYNTQQQTTCSCHLHGTRQIQAFSKIDNLRCSH